MFIKGLGQIILILDEKGDVMEFCILCKEMVDKTYTLTATDSEINNGVEGHVCATCYQRLIDSFHNKRSFKISLMKSWSKRKIPSFHK